MGFERTRVRRVYVRSNAHRLRNVLIGVGIGFGIGALVDSTVGAFLRNETGQGSGARAATYLAPIALGGALGARPTWQTVYREP